ncbi:hypothetical protein SCUCBS95973_004158 [Sporothrix curviconia]|uniref:Uncharacterized protein n=1 Tax=Sporothrix curviconia TaxID=1260050 RepID=A0ABP0BLG9_9PEZI
MSAHLCKQIYASWRQTHDNHSTSMIYNQVPERAVADDKHYHISTSTLSSYMPYRQRSVSPPSKRSMDSDRSDEER